MGARAHCTSTTILRICLFKDKFAFLQGDCPLTCHHRIILQLWSCQELQRVPVLAVCPNKIPRASLVTTGAVLTALPFAYARTVAGRAAISDFQRLMFGKS